MTQEEQEWAKSYWRFEYARISFVQAREAAEHILREKLTSGHPLLMPLITAVYTLYAKPFKENRGVGKFGTEIVPKESLLLHEVIIGFRDRLHAHRDGNGPTVDGFGPLNQAEAVRGKAGRLLFRMTNVFDRPNQLEAIAALCKELEKKCEYHGGRFQRRLAERVPSKVGVYRLNLGDLKSPIWIPSGAYPNGP